MNPDSMFPTREADAYDRFDQLDDLVPGPLTLTSGRPAGSAYDEALDSET